MSISFDVKYAPDKALDDEEAVIAASWRVDGSSDFDACVRAAADIVHRSDAAYGRADLAADPAKFMAHQFAHLVPAVATTRALFRRFVYRTTIRDDHKSIDKGVDVRATIDASVVPGGPRRTVNCAARVAGEGAARRLQFGLWGDFAGVKWEKSGAGPLRCAETFGDREFCARVSGIVNDIL